MMLELFKFESCPFCQRVLKYIRQTGRKDIILRDIHENKVYERRLLMEGGKKQVPCLFIDGKPLYESLEILKWLKDHPEQ